MVLEKKQSPGSYSSQTDTAGKESLARTGPVNRINEPDDVQNKAVKNTSYREWNNNNIMDGSESGPGGTFSDEPQLDQNEDDLPF